MTTTDHAAEAERMLLIPVSMTDATQENLLATAQVHATLALVEQQRIANLVALARVESENAMTPTDALDAIYWREAEGFTLKLHTRPDIAAALGVGGSDA